MVNWPFLSRRDERGFREAERRDLEPPEPKEDELTPDDVEDILHNRRKEREISDQEKL